MDRLSTTSTSMSLAAGVSVSTISSISSSASMVASTPITAGTKVDYLSSHLLRIANSPVDLATFFRVYHFDFTSANIFESIMKLHANALIHGPIVYAIMVEWHQVEDVDIKYHIYDYFKLNLPELLAEYIQISGIKTRAPRRERKGSNRSIRRKDIATEVELKKAVVEDHLISSDSTLDRPVSTDSVSSPRASLLLSPRSSMTISPRSSTGPLMSNSPRVSASMSNCSWINGSVSTSAPNLLSLSASTVTSAEGCVKSSSSLINASISSPLSSTSSVSSTDTVVPRPLNLSIPMLCELFHPEDLAGKIAIYTRDLVAGVTVKELARRGSHSAESIKRCINFFDVLSDHIKWEILFNANASNSVRESVVITKIDYYLTVAELLHKVYNYEALYIIYSSLNHHHIIKRIGQKSSRAKRYETYNSLFDYHLNYKNYRDDVKQLTRYIPVFSLILKDLTLTAEVPIGTTDGLLNVSKLEVLDKILAPHLIAKSLYPERTGDLHFSLVMDNISIYNHNFDVLKLDPTLLELLPNLSARHVRICNVINDVTDVSTKASLNKVRSSIIVNNPDFIQFSIIEGTVVTILEFNLLEYRRKNLPLPSIGAAVAAPDFSCGNNDFCGYTRRTVASALSFANDCPEKLSHRDRGRWYIELYKVDMINWTKFDVITFCMHNSRSKRFVENIRVSGIDGRVLDLNTIENYVKHNVADDRNLHKLRKQVRRFKLNIAFYLENLIFLDVENWTAHDVAAWFEDIGMTIYINFFLENGINGRDIILCNSEMLKNWIIESKGDLVISRTNPVLKNWGIGSERDLIMPLNNPILRLWLIECKGDLVIPFDSEILTRWGVVSTTDLILPRNNEVLRSWAIESKGDAMRFRRLRKYNFSSWDDDKEATDSQP